MYTKIKFYEEEKIQQKYKNIVVWFQEDDASPSDSPKETLFFNDGRRRIDFVLVYKDTEGDNKSRQRRLFEDNLITAGLKIEIEDKEVGIETG